MRKVRQWSPESQATFDPPELFEELKKELCDEKDKKSHVVRALKRLDTCIASKRTLQGRHTLTRFTAIRLTKAKAEEHAQYTSSAHLLQWVPSSMLNKYSQGKKMRALRYLQIEGYLNKEEPPVPRADLKKKKTRAVGKRSTSHDMMFNWVHYERGQLSLKHPISTPQSGIHTIRTVPEVINSFMDKKNHTCMI